MIDAGADDVRHGAVMESWYAAGMVSLSFHASKGAAKTVRMTITATFCVNAGDVPGPEPCDWMTSERRPSSLSLEDPSACRRRDLRVLRVDGRNSPNDLNLRTRITAARSFPARSRRGGPGGTMAGGLAAVRGSVERIPLRATPRR